MLDRTAAAVQALQTDQAHLSDQDEVDHILTILCILKKQVNSPVVRECLEAARSDIAHLTGPVGAVDGEDADDDFDGREGNDA